MNNQISRDEVRSAIEDKLSAQFSVSGEAATNEQIFQATAIVIRELMSRLLTIEDPRHAEKEIHYMSMEFLMGRSLMKSAYNLGISEAVTGALEDMGRSASDIFEEEPDAGLGNGGLGRLAACYLDSLAAEDVPCVGMGLRYRYGLFRQRIRSGCQTEEPDDWLSDGYPWETAVPSEAVEVRFGGTVDRREENGRMVYELRDYRSVLATPYDVPILGYGAHAVNNLRLWRAGPVHKQLDLDAFNAGDYSRAQKANNDAEAITCLLYPDDNTPAGQQLRLQQEYFFVCAGLQSMLRTFRATHLPWDKLPERVAIHTNDTHPALCVPELMRLLMDGEGLSWEEAWDITCRTISYTNHTVMPEALEKWPVSLMRALLPRQFQIIEEIDRRWRESFDQSVPGWHDRQQATAVIGGGFVRMANLSVIGGHSVNGVAKLHTEILKNTVLRDFYAISPEKFNNKTNGVSHRRFLLQSNPGLSRYIAERVGDGWVEQPEKLEGLLAYADDTESLRELAKVKLAAKKNLCDYIARGFGIACNPDGVIDVQVKRIHAYKRQLLNAFKILALYDRLKDDPYAKVPASTFVFAGKAAHSYAFAKESIRFVCAVADLVNADPVVSRRMKVVFMENFGVTMGQRIYPAADISEQISTAGKEASGTGCMKFMMNGAVTLGTLDGANVEILERVGAENISIFGLTSEETERFTTQGGYNARECAESDPVLARVLAHLTDGSLGSKFWDLEDALLKYNDEFFVLRDFAPYLAAWDALAGETGNLSFQRKALVNIAKSGWFSSDRAVAEYVSDIWKIR